MVSVDTTKRIVVPDGTHVRLLVQRIAFPSYAEWRLKSTGHNHTDDSLDELNASLGVIKLVEGTDAIVLNSQGVIVRVRLENGHEYDITAIIAGEEMDCDHFTFL